MQLDAQTTTRSNGVWAIPMHSAHIYKTGLSTQMAYLRMAQGLTGAPSTYSKAKDIITVSSAISSMTVRKRDDSGSTERRQESRAMARKGGDSKKGISANILIPS